MLPRVLEPEVMDTAEEARDYDAMDHSQVNRVFVAGPDGRGVPQAHLSDARRSRLRDFGFDDHLLLNPAGWWSAP